MTSLTPWRGRTAGGDDVTLTGTGFHLGMEVRLGNRLANVRSVGPSGTTAIISTPINVAGAATLQITSIGGATLVRHGAFLYEDPLSVTKVTPSRGPTSGGTRVVIDGSGFTPGGPVRVTFAGVDAESTRVVGLGRIEAVTPGGQVGPVDVEVRNPDGTSVTLVKGPAA